MTSASGAGSSLVPSGAPPAPPAVRSRSCRARRGRRSTRTTIADRALAPARGGSAPTSSASRWPQVFARYAGRVPEVGTVSSNRERLVGGCQQLVERHVVVTEGPDERMHSKRLGRRGVPDCGPGLRAERRAPRRAGGAPRVRRGRRPPGVAGGGAVASVGRNGRSYRREWGAGA
jgi:hypothetical protein